MKVCDNEATSMQVEILAEQLPSMNQRITEAYKNTREFVNFIKSELPEAKINFVSKENLNLFTFRDSQKLFCQYIVCKVNILYAMQVC